MKPRLPVSSPKTHLRTLLEQEGIKAPLSDHFYQQIVLSMNGAKGTSGEFLVHTAILDMLRESPDSVGSVPPITQHVFQTPDGARRVDLYFAETRFAVEIKAGYVRATRAFRKQVGKDVWLLESQSEPVSEVMWIFLRGATTHARRYLEDRHIAWIDFDIENRRPPVASQWPGTS